MDTGEYLYSKSDFISDSACPLKVPWIAEALAAVMPLARAICPRCQPKSVRLQQYRMVIAVRGGMLDIQ